MSLKFLFLLFLFFDKQMGLKVGNNPVSELKDEFDSPAEEIWCPNVQEMVRTNPLRVPEIFIRNDTNMGNEKQLLPISSDEIPVIDLAILRSGSKEELLKLDMACKDWGYFQLKNGVQTQLLQEMKDATAYFFNLPLEEKNKYAMPRQMNMQGYGHIQVHNEEHKLDWLDGLLLLAQPVHSRNYSFWPQTPLGYREIVDKYSSELNQVGVELFNYLSVIIGKEAPSLLGLPVYFEVNYYPPCSKPNRVLNMSPHFDQNSITLVMQDQDDVNELEIMHDEVWVPVTAISNALICNVGDFIEKWSDKRYKSVKHRVVANKTKVRSVHEIGLMPAIEEMVELNSVDELNRVDDLVNRYLKRRGN